MFWLGVLVGVVIYAAVSVWRGYAEWRQQRAVQEWYATHFYDFGAERWKQG